MTTTTPRPRRRLKVTATLAAVLVVYGAAKLEQAHPQAFQVAVTALIALAAAAVAQQLTRGDTE